MRTWFWTLLLIVVAVAVAVVLQTHTGNVVLLIPPYRIELSFTLAMLGLAAAFVVMYVGLRVLARLLSIPARVRDWRGRRAQARDHDLMEKGWVGLLEGRYAQAEKHFVKLVGQTRVESRRSVAALSAAHAAQELGEFSRRDNWLEQARLAADGDPSLIEAVATVSADMLLDQGCPAQALTVLAPLQDVAARHLHTTRLLLRAKSELGHHDQVFTLARTLARRHAIARPEAERLIEVSGAARLRASLSNGDDWRLIWKDMKSAERAYPEIALAAAQAFDAAGDTDESACVLETAINQKFMPLLVAAYARCDASQVKHRIEKAEGWLRQHPNDQDLLRVLGVLCLTGQIWGAAERYLKRSLKQRNDPQTHALLGSLYDRLNRSQDAAQHWRMATAVGMALPNLASEAALPAADTGADPIFAAAAVADLEGVYAATGDDTKNDRGWPSPLEQYPDTARVNVPPAHQVQLPPQTELDDYLDSAPPPAGVLDDAGSHGRATPLVSVAPRDDLTSKP